MVVWLCISTASLTSTPLSVTVLYEGQAERSRSRYTYDVIF